jgi:CRISPR-associated protein Cas1
MIEHVAALETLRAAFQKVKANRGAAGGDGVTIAAFSRGLEPKLRQLSMEIVNGAYWPAPVRLVDIPKNDGGLRRLSIPAIVDRVAQTAAAMILGPRLEREFEDSSFGYRPGRSVKQAVRRVDQLRRQGYVWAVDADIDDYFDSVPHNPLIDALEQHVPCERTVDLVCRWLEAYAPTGVGLPQGAPISPLLANLYLDALDEELEGKGVRIVRYADDFVVLCKSEAKAEATLSRTAVLLKERGLKLEPEKTQIVSFDKGLRFLGHLFVRSLVLKEVDFGEEPAILPEAVAALTAEDAREEDDPELTAGEVEGGARSPGLTVLYMMEPGRSLEVYGEALAVEEDGAPILAVPTDRIGRIEIGPQAAASTQALRHAAANGIGVALADGYGGTIASVVPAQFQRPEVQLAQARHALDEALRLDLARRFAIGRIRNQRALLRRLNGRTRRRHKRLVKQGVEHRREEAAALLDMLKSVDRAAHDIGRVARLIPLQDSTEAIMGVEGRAGAMYWPALGRLLERGFQFEKRSRRPPADPVNATISFLASLLERDLTALIQRRGLNPGIGYLHAVQDARASLTLDLMEEFRPHLIDGLAVYLFNNRILKPEMFDRDKEKGCLMWAPGVKALIRGYEERLDSAVSSPRSHRKVKWRRLMDEQVLALKRHLAGDETYQPYEMDH